MIFKYIILLVVNNRDVAKEIPFIFTKDCVHRNMFDSMRHMLMMKHRAKAITCVGAGFIEMSTLKCHGHSESLAIESREIDSDLIKNYVYNYSFLQDY